jgi:hypothetical protein
MACSKGGLNTKQWVICVLAGSVGLLVSLFTKWLSPQDYSFKHRAYGKHNTQRKILPKEEL